MSLRRLIEARPFAIVDGGLATELEACGCSIDDPLWSGRALLDEAGQSALLEVHRRWLDAGADILASASYQLSIAGLRAAGLDAAQAERTFARSVELARSVAGERTIVAGSLGSYGACLADGSEYRGDYRLSVAELIEFHRSRVEPLAHAGPDVLAFETVPNAAEAEAIARVLDDQPLDAWVAFSLRPGDGPVRIADGTALADAVAPLLAHPRVLAIGVNCVGPSEVLPALDVLAIVGAATIAYPNSGERWVDRGWAGPALDVDAFVALAARWHRAGARILGGCCRTRPDHVRALAGLRARIGMPTPAPT